VWGDADHFSAVAARERSSPGLDELEADEACDETRVMINKPCAHILLLLHYQLLPSVLGVQHVGCEVLECDGILELLVDNFLKGAQ